MIDTFELYEELCGSVNTQQGGHVRPSRNFLQWVNSISLTLFEEKFASWSKSQKIVDDLSKPFLKSVLLTVKDVGSSYGVGKFPDDYGHFSSARFFVTTGDQATGTVVPATGLPLYDCCGKLVESFDKDACVPQGMDGGLWEILQKAAQTEAVASGALLPSSAKEITVDMISNDRWGACTAHRFNAPTLAIPKMTQFEGGFKVAPAGVGTLVLDYLRIPKAATFEYTTAPADLLTGRGDYLIYDKVKSQPLEWSSLVRNEFLHRLDKKYGKYIREEFIWQVSEADRKTTVG